MIATVDAQPSRGDAHEALRSPDRSRLDRRRGARCEPSAGTGAKPNGAGDGNEARSHHRRPGHAQGDTRKAEGTAGETRRLSQTGAPTQNPVAEAACLRQSLHVAFMRRGAAPRHALTGCAIAVFDGRADLYLTGEGPSVLKVSRARTRSPMALRLKSRTAAGAQAGLTQNARAPLRSKC